MKPLPSFLLICLPLILAVGIPKAPLVAGNFDAANRAEMMDKMVRVRAVQFLQRTTFGPKPAEIEALTQAMKTDGIQQAASDWIDAQFAMPHTSHVEMAKTMLTEDGLAHNVGNAAITQYRIHAWWHNAITAPDQLKQRIAWALSQIVVVNHKIAGFDREEDDKNGNPQWFGNAIYYDMLLENSDDTYGELIEDVTFSPIMGRFLSHWDNKKGDPALGTFPDENYAREVMQLFTIGLNELKQDGVKKRNAEDEPIPTYDNETIKAFARLFTGFRFKPSVNSNGGSNYGTDLHHPMVVVDSRHDFDSKTLLNGETLSGYSDGKLEIQDGLRNLMNHPNVAPFVSRLLIQRLVRSNPSRGYMRRVSATYRDNGAGQRGDLKAVVKAILLDRECWNSIRVTRKRKASGLQVRVWGTGTERNRMAEPILMYTGMMRRFGSPDSGVDGDDDVDGKNYVSAGKFKLPSLINNWPQAPYLSPSVFNFYSPDFQPAGDISEYTASRRIPDKTIYAPEFQLLHSVSANKMANLYRSNIYNEKYDGRIAYGSNNRYVKINLDFSALKLMAHDANALAKYLDLNLCAGTMKQSFRNELVDALEVQTSGESDELMRRNRVHGALISVMMSPAQMIVE